MASQFNFFIITLIISILLISWKDHEKVNYLSKHITIPGTDISMMVPENIFIAPAGSILVNKDYTILINIAIGKVEYSLKNNPTWLATFPHNEGIIKSGKLSGTLRSRTRKVDKGGYDGYTISFDKDKKNLLVTIYYLGNAPLVFDKLKKVFNTISWKETI